MIRAITVGTLRRRLRRDHLHLRTTPPRAMSELGDFYVLDDDYRIVCSGSPDEIGRDCEALDAGESVQLND